MGEFENLKGDQCPCNVENWESTGEEEERQDLTGHLIRRLTPLSLSFPARPTGSSLYLLLNIQTLKASVATLTCLW